MHVEVPHRARCPPYLLEQLQPTLRRIVKRSRSSPSRVPGLRRCAPGPGCRALPLSDACRCALSCTESTVASLAQASRVCLNVSVSCRRRACSAPATVLPGLPLILIFWPLAQMISMITPHASPQVETSAEKPALLSSPVKAWCLLLLVFVAVHFAALFAPAILDDADASHAQAAAPIWPRPATSSPFRSTASAIWKNPRSPTGSSPASIQDPRRNAFATHLPNALAVLACAWLAWLWSRRAWGDRAALYAGLGTLTCCGPFLFTRFYIPEALLSLPAAARPLLPPSPASKASAPQRASTSPGPRSPSPRSLRASSRLSSSSPRSSPTAPAQRPVASLA